jgi:hypothetical protein
VVETETSWKELINLSLYGFCFGTDVAISDLKKAKFLCGVDSSLW